MTSDTDNKIIYIPINLRLRRLGIENINVTKEYVSIDCISGPNFKIRYTDCKDISERAEDELLNNNDYVSADFIEEITGFLIENYDLIKDAIKSFKGDGV